MASAAGTLGALPARWAGAAAASAAEPAKKKEPKEAEELHPDLLEELKNPADAKIKVSRYHSECHLQGRGGEPRSKDDDKKPYDGVIGNGQAAAALGKQLNQSKGIRNLELQHQNLEPKAMESLAKPMAGLESLEELVRPPPGCFCSLRLHRC